MSPVITTKSPFCVPYKALIKHIFIDQLSFYTDKDSNYILADLQFAKDIGIEYVILTGADLGSHVWGVDKPLALGALARVVTLVKGMDMKVAIPSAIYGRYFAGGEYSTLTHNGAEDDVQDLLNWGIDTEYFALTLANLNPDGWYLDCELQTAAGAPNNGVGPQTTSQAFAMAINAMMSAKPGDLWMSPYWMEGLDELQKKIWNRFLKSIPKAPFPFMSVSAIQDRVGAFGIDPGTSTPNIPKYTSQVLPKLKWHKAVCEANGWLGQVNIELFGGYGGPPPTWDRIKKQLDGECRSDIISSKFIEEGNIGCGPSWEYAGNLSPQKSDANRVLYNAYKTYREG